MKKSSLAGPQYRYQYGFDVIRSKNNASSSWSSKSFRSYFDEKIARIFEALDATPYTIYSDFSHQFNSVSAKKIQIQNNEHSTEYKHYKSSFPGWRTLVWYDNNNEVYDPLSQSRRIVVNLTSKNWEEFISRLLHTSLLFSQSTNIRQNRRKTQIPRLKWNPSSTDHSFPRLQADKLLIIFDIFYYFFD